MIGGPFGVRLPWADLASGALRRIVKSGPIDQCEDCSLKKKKGHCYSRAFFLKRKTRRLKTLQNTLQSAQKPKRRPFFRLLLQTKN